MLEKKFSLDPFHWIYINIIKYDMRRFALFLRLFFLRLFMFHYWSICTAIWFRYSIWICNSFGFICNICVGARREGLWSCQDDVTKRKTWKGFQTNKWISNFVASFTIPSSQQVLSSADKLCKQFGPRSGLTKLQSWSGFKLFETVISVLKVFLKKCLFGFILLFFKKSADVNKKKSK